MARLYADEHVPFELIQEICTTGHDVTSVVQARRCGGSDDQVLTDATSDDRAVLTFDRWDFERLHRRRPLHAGIISCTRDDDVLAARIDRAIAAAGPLAGRHIRVNLPAAP